MSSGETKTVIVGKHARERLQQRGGSDFSIIQKYIEKNEEIKAIFERNGDSEGYLSIPGMTGRFYITRDKYSKGDHVYYAKSYLGTYMPKPEWRGTGRKKDMIVRLS